MKWKVLGLLLADLVVCFQGHDAFIYFNAGFVACWIPDLFADCEAS